MSEDRTKQEFYRRVEAGERPYSKQLARDLKLRPGQQYRWLKSRPVPTDVHVTITPPRPTSAQPVEPRIEEPSQPIPPALTEDECIDLYKFIWSKEGLIADGLLEAPEAGRSDIRCEAQGKRLYAIAVKYGWDREQMLGFLGIAIFCVGVGQDSYAIYRVWNEKQKEKKKTVEKKPMISPEIMVPKAEMEAIEKRLGITGPPKV